MNFQQLRIIRETVRQGFNLTEVSNALHTSQSGVSKHIKDLEDELGLELFVRHGKRLLGLTEPGQELAKIVERILTEVSNIKNVAEEFTQSDRGELIVATTHTQARYALPAVIAAFKQTFPQVHLVLHQANPAEIATMVQQGRADIGIATEALSAHADLVAFPYYSWHHAIIVPKGHALESIVPLTIEAVAAYPLITYHEGFTGRPAIDRAFARAGLKPDLVMAALDADVIKAYVELGIGVGIVGSMAFDAARDQKLTLLPSDHLFDRSTTFIALRRGRKLRGFASRFIQLAIPQLPARDIDEAMAQE